LIAFVEESKEKYGESEDILRDRRGGGVEEGRDKAR